MRFQILQKLALNKIETVTIHRVFATDLMTSRCNSRSVPNFLSPTLPCILALLLVNRIQEHLHGTIQLLKYGDSVIHNILLVQSFGLFFWLEGLMDAQSHVSQYACGDETLVRNTA